MKRLILLVFAFAVFAAFAAAKDGVAGQGSDATIRPGDSKEAMGGGEVDYIGCTSKNDRHPFSLEAHGKPDGSLADTLVRFRNCRIEPANDRVFFRRLGQCQNRHGRIGQGGMRPRRR